MRQGRGYGDVVKGKRLSGGNAIVFVMSEKQRAPFAGGKGGSSCNHTQFVTCGLVRICYSTGCGKLLTK